MAPRLKSAMTKSIYFTISEICYRPLFLLLSLWSSPFHAIVRGSGLLPAFRRCSRPEEDRLSVMCCQPCSHLCTCICSLLSNDRFTLKYNVLHDYWKGPQDKERNDAKKERPKKGKNTRNRGVEGTWKERPTLRRIISCVHIYKCQWVWRVL